MKKQLELKTLQGKKALLETERYEIFNATSDCMYNQCDGKGMIIIKDKINNVLSGMECKCKEDAKRNKAIAFADIPLEFKDLTIKSFDVDMYTGEVSRQLAIAAKCAAAGFINNYSEFMDSGKGLYIYGNTKGSGKTRLAASIGNALIYAKGVDVKFTTTINLFSEIKKTYNSEKDYNQGKLLDAIKNVDVLILDDIGVEKQSAWVNEVFYSIINDRMIMKKITIFTSNVSIEKLDYDEIIINRIVKMAVPIRLSEESIRTKLAQQENERFIELLYKKP